MCGKLFIGPLFSFCFHRKTSSTNQVFYHYFSKIGGEKLAKESCYDSEKEAAMISGLQIAVLKKYAVVLLCLRSLGNLKCCYGLSLLKCDFRCFSFVCKKIELCFDLCTLCAHCFSNKFSSGGPSISSQSDNKAVT